MNSFLCITIRFLQPYAHGRGEEGEPEWPPSPLRVLQALVAAGAGRWNERRTLNLRKNGKRDWLHKAGRNGLSSFTSYPNLLPTMRMIGLKLVGKRYKPRLAKRFWTFQNWQSLVNPMRLTAIASA